MSEFLKHGQRVKYKHEETQKVGTVHGVRTYEDANGKVLRVTYLIDTGKTVREDIGMNPKTKKPETVRQPEQVEIDQTQIVRD